MTKKLMHLFSNYKNPVLCSLLIILLLNSCGVEKIRSYYEGGLDTTAVESYRYPELVIQKGDQLGIVIYSDNPEATAIYNQLAGSTAPSASSVSQQNSRQMSSNAMKQTLSAGYPVDQDGNIRIHGLGLIHAEGHTRASLEKYLNEKISSLGVLSNPYCVVQFSSIRLTILGEVRSPGVFFVQNEKMNLFDALALAGDIIVSGRKEKVLLIREENGKRAYATIDLTKTNISTSPYFYLKQNDILIVQPNRMQQSVLMTQRQQNISIIVQLMSVIVILLNLFIN